MLMHVSWISSIIVLSETVNNLVKSCLSSLSRKTHPTASHQTCQSTILSPLLIKQQLSIYNNFHPFSSCQSTNNFHPFSSCQSTTTFTPSHQTTSCQSTTTFTPSHQTTVVNLQQRSPLPSNNSKLLSIYNNFHPSSLKPFFSNNSKYITLNLGYRILDNAKYYVRIRKHVCCIYKRKGTGCWLQELPLLSFP